MTQQLTELLSNPVVAILVALTILVLLPSVILLAIYAIRQGCEVSFWPPKIGPRTALPLARIAGSRLFQHAGYYPIQTAPHTNHPSFDPAIFSRAIHHLAHEVDDKLATMDLIYLREDNRANGFDVLRPEYAKDYEKLIVKYKLQDFRDNWWKDTESLFRNVRRIVEDLGDTLHGTHSEFVLHDVRNPLRSVILAKNTEGISDRRVGNPSTRFVVEYLRHQGHHLTALENESHVSYPKQFFDTKVVKATTIPLFDERYGLIGLLCFNIDIDQVKKLSQWEQRDFFERYARTQGETPEYEKDAAPVAPGFVFRETVAAVHSAGPRDHSHPKRRAVGGWRHWLFSSFW